MAWGERIVWEIFSLLDAYVGLVVVYVFVVVVVVA